MEVYPKRKWEPELKTKAANVSRTGHFFNQHGLKIRWYSWEVAQPKAVIAFAHGIGVYGSFEMLASNPPGTPRQHYASSWPERANEAGVSLFCLDHQGHGRSDYARGKRCYFERIQHLVDDFALFVGKLKTEFADGTPVFMVGTSLGGYVATRAAIDYPDAANGLVALAPALSLDRIAAKPLNKILLPFTTILSMMIPTVPLPKTVKNVKFPLTQQEVENDVLTWPSGVKRTRVRVAAEVYLASLALKQPGVIEKITMPMITFHGRDDVYTDPKGSAMLYERASSSDKRLEWVDDVFHDLCHEKPTSDEICDEILSWVLARSNFGTIDANAKPAKRARKSKPTPSKSERSAASAKKSSSAKSKPKPASKPSGGRRASLTVSIGSSRAAKKASSSSRATRRRR